MNKKLLFILLALCSIEYQKTIHSMEFEEKTGSEKEDREREFWVNLHFNVAAGNPDDVKSLIQENLEIINSDPDEVEKLFVLAEKGYIYHKKKQNLERKKDFKKAIRSLRVFLKKHKPVEPSDPFSLGLNRLSTPGLTSCPDKLQSYSFFRESY